MTITPIDLRRAEFRRALRGYAADEVDDYLRTMSDELTRLLGEVERLKHERRSLREELSRAREREQELQNAIIRAQRMAEDMVGAAKKEAHQIVRESELTADRIVRQAIDQAARVEGRIGELQLKRTELLAKLRLTVQLFEQLLEAESAEEPEPSASIRALPGNRH